MYKATLREGQASSVAVHWYVLTLRKRLAFSYLVTSLAANKYTTLDEVSEALKDAGLESSNLIVGWWIIVVHTTIIKIVLAHAAFFLYVQG